MRKFYLAAFVLLTQSLVAQTVYNFTAAGASGTNGPNQSMVNSAYASTNLAGTVNVSGAGIQNWIVPATGEYTISAAGAQGGSTSYAQGGQGREITTKVNLIAGHNIAVLIGQMGGLINFNYPYYDYYWGYYTYYQGAAGGGGGGTYVVDLTTNTLLLAVGGGGGAADGMNYTSQVLNGSDAAAYNATTGTSGNSNNGSSGSGGTSGNGGSNNYGSSGAGYSGNGSAGYNAYYASSSFINGGTGSANSVWCGSINTNNPGGFGGGSGANVCTNYAVYGGAGGGYSGGGGAGYYVGSGGGGGNYYTGTYVSNSLNTGDGKCSITRNFSADIVQIGYNCSGAATGSLTVELTGGTAPYTYLWSNSETTDTISGLSAGTYSVTVTDAFGTSASGSITIADPAINATLIGTNLACANGSVPNKVVTSVEYRFMASSTYANQFTAYINGTPVGAMSTQNDYNCYETVQTLTVTNPASLSLITNGTNSFGFDLYANQFGWTKAVIHFSDGSTQTVVISDYYGYASSEFSYVCYYSSYGYHANSANVQITPTYNPYPGTLNLTTSQPGAYTYLWETGSTTEDIIVTSPGTYTVTITQPECGYVFTDSVEISAPANSITNNTTVDTCGNAYSGSIDVSVSGFTSPITYSWNTGASSQDLNNIPTGNYILTVSDASGCAPTVADTIKVITGDFTSPLAMTQDITVQLDVNGQATIPNNAVDNGSYDNCGTVTFSLSQTSFNCSHLGSNTVTMNVYDAQNNMSSAPAIITIKDTVKPVFTSMPADVTVNAVNSLCGKVVTFASPTYSDNCSASMARTDNTGLVSGDIFPVGVTTIVYTLTDVSGNVFSDSFDITVLDTQAPQITGCPADITVNTGNNCGATVNWNAPTASDNCPGTILTASHNQGSMFPTGATIVSYTATDASGNTVNCSFTVTVIDNAAPVAPLLATQTGECTVTVSLPSAMDNCSGAITGTTMDPLTYSAQGNYTIHWTFTDGSGNMTTANQVVIVHDVTAPAVPILADLTGECGVSAAAPTTTDNCNGMVTGQTLDPITYSTPGTYTIHWTFTDGNGNVSSSNQTVIVIDQTAPVAPSLSALNGECSVTLTAPQALDNCAGLITGTTVSPMTISTQGTHTVTWTFNDGNGNTSTTNQTVVISDTTNPVAMAQDVTVTLDANGNATVLASAVNNGSSDNCGIASMSVSPATFTCSQVGANNVSLTITDINGNTSIATAVVTVQDLTPLSFISVPQTITAVASNGLCGKVINYALPTFSDNCSTQMTQTDGSGLSTGDIFPIGTTTQTYTVTNSAGDVISHTFNIIVTDNQVPVLTGCPSNITVNATPNQCGVNVMWSQPTASDNCPALNVVASANPGSFFPIGVTTVTYTATDASGNATTCSFNVTVMDVTAPSIPTLTTITGTCGVTVPVATATDACGGTITGTTSDPLSYTSIGTHLVNWTFTDVNGNSSSAQQTIVVNAATSVDLVSSCGAYTWIDGQTYTASNNSATFTLTSGGGCDSIVTLNLTVTGVVTSTAVVNSNGTMTASGGTTYQWIDCSSMQTVENGGFPTIQPATSGSYACIVGNGSCTDTTECMWFSPLTVKELESSAWNVYPNPSAGMVTVEFTGSQGELTIYDATGKLLQKGQITQKELVDMSAYDRGMYVFELITETGTGIRRVIKN